MTTKKHDNSHMKQDAFYAYLEYCNYVKVAPDKEIYETLLRGSNLDSMTAFIEWEHGNFEKKRNSETDLETFKERFLEKFELKPIEVSQKVKLDYDSEKEVEQSVSFDPFDNWLSVTHDGNAITLNRENWYKLSDLVEKAQND